MKRTALFAGSFNPFTLGHASIVERSLALFDRVIIAIGVNPDKTMADDVAARRMAIEQVYGPEMAEGRVEVVVYTRSLTAVLARELGADFLVRGIRSVRDFEYERDLADVNRRINGIETVLLPALPEYGAVSSSVVRELASYGHDVSEFLPKPVK